MAAMAGQSSSETRSTGPIDPTSAARITFTSVLSGAGGEIELSSSGVLPVTVSQEMVETSLGAPVEVAATTFGVGTGTYSWVFTKDGFTRQIGIVSANVGESKTVSVSVTPEKQAFDQLVIGGVLVAGLGALALVWYLDKEA